MAAALLSACGGPIVENVAPPAGPSFAARTLESGPQALRQHMDAVTDADWLVLTRPDGRGTVGGFLSREPHRGGLVVLLGGASTFDPLGRFAATHDFYQDFGSELRRAGFRVYAPLLAEADTPYGGEDLAQVEDVLDWLEAGGRAYLGAERVYVAGYSTGGTLVNLLNARRRVTALVAMCGLAEPVQFEAYYGFYQWLAARYPENTGFRQLAETLHVYGRPGSVRWYALDAVARVGQFRNPTLLVHGDADWVYFTDNTRHIEERYRALLRAGRTELPPLEFHYVPWGNHFSAGYDPGARRRILDFLRSFEPAAR